MRALLEYGVEDGSGDGLVFGDGPELLKCGMGALDARPSRASMKSSKLPPSAHCIRTL